MCRFWWLCRGEVYDASAFGFAFLSLWLLLLRFHFEWDQFLLCAIICKIRIIKTRIIAVESQHCSYKVSVDRPLSNRDLSYLFSRVLSARRAMKRDVQQNVKWQRRDVRSSTSSIIRLWIVQSSTLWATSVNRQFCSRQLKTSTR